MGGKTYKIMKDGVIVGKPYFSADGKKRDTRHMDSSLAEPQAQHVEISNAPDGDHNWNDEIGEWKFPLGEYCAAAIIKIKDLGTARVYQFFPRKKQRRLAFKPAADDNRKACSAMIEAVKAEVDKSEGVINAAINPAEIDAEAANFVIILEGIPGA